jgi:hypothetical protein
MAAHAVGHYPEAQRVVTEEGVLIGGPPPPDIRATV